MDISRSMSGEGNGWFWYFFIKCDLDRSTTHSKFDPTEVRTHDLQIMTVHSMSLRRLLSPLGHLVTSMSGVDKGRFQEHEWGR